MPDARILIADDEPFNLDIITEYLDGSGYALTCAAGGEEAWDILCAEPAFDLVVLDRMMPGTDGMEVLRRVKADDRLATVPVIMQTAAVAPEQVREGLAAGASYYLTKPFEPETLLTIVRAALEDAAQRARLQERLVEHGEALSLVDHAEFSFRTLDEAQRVAVLVASICQNPDMVVMGLSELLVNGIEHGNLGITFAEKSRLKEEDRWREEVEARLASADYSRKRVRLSVKRGLEDWEFVITDEGLGFDWPRYLAMDAERAFAPNGRGIALARQLAFGDLEYQGNGNTVRATVLRRPRP
jgi:CheY-like chemotaxis protein/anti-sigma regulatory factor (Ser/Thr protein kinase)